MKITMNEIAKLAGVGKSTVSRYFNGGYVKEDTREKIKEIIEKYDYSPNTVAQALKAKHSYQVVIITPTLESTTAGRVITTMDETLRAQGYTPIIFNTNHNEERELMSILSLSRMNVEGAILLATHITDAHKELVRKLHIPFLCVAQETDLTVHVTLDDYLAGYKIGQYVAQKNHKNITYVGVSEEDAAVGVTRKSGIYAALKENGVENIHYLETKFTYEEASSSIREYLPTCEDTCLICATDNIALAAYHEIAKIGKKVGEDISVTGFGGYNIASIVTPNLCTIHFHYEEEGTIAGEIMGKMIHEEEVNNRKVGFTFMEGKSVKEL